jgi:hypothetical protein
MVEISGQLDASGRTELEGDLFPFSTFFIRAGTGGDDEDALLGSILANGRSAFDFVGVRGICRPLLIPFRIEGNLCLGKKLSEMAPGA